MKRLIITLFLALPAAVAPCFADQAPDAPTQEKIVAWRARQRDIRDQRIADYEKEDKAVRAILGEARGEGYRGMYAVACALRNRLKSGLGFSGVYGINTIKWVDGAGLRVYDPKKKIYKMEQIGPDLYQLASKAWHESEDGPDVTNGATHWENTDDFGVPIWARGKRPTAIVGRHRFFKVK